MMQFAMILECLAISKYPRRCFLMMGMLHRWSMLVDLSIKLMVGMNVIIDVVDKSDFG